VPLDDPSQLEVGCIPQPITTILTDAVKGFGKNIEWLDLTDIAGWDMDFFFDS